MFILGTAMGSFAYVLALRSYDGRDWVNGHSECEHCHELLKWYDLVPVASWLSTLGKCRYCKKSIGATYITVELATGALFLLSYRYWPYGFEHLGVSAFVLWLISLTVLISLVIIDLKWFLLPDGLVFSLIGIAGAFQLYVVAYTQDFSRLPGILGGIAVGFGIFYLLYMVSSGRYIGGGDVKYGLYIGLLTGSALKSLLVISVASLLGTLAVLPLLITKKTKLTSKIPFGPFLILATIIVFIFGQKILDWYTGFYLFP